MLFWANVHGGFICGTAIAGIYIFSELIRAFFDRGHKISKQMIVISTVTIFAGLLNPNGYNVIYGIITESSPVIKATIMELMTPFAYIGLGVYRYIIWTFAYLAAAVLSVIVCVIVEYRKQNTGVRSQNSEFRNEEPEVGTETRYTLHATRCTLSTVLLSYSEEIFVIALFGFLSLSAIRAIPLLAIVATPIIGRMLSGRPNSILLKLSRFMIPEAIVVCAVLWGVWKIYPATILKEPILDDYFPEATVRFIKSRNLSDRLFNYYDWGGYLIWSFYPDQVVFMDGRGLSRKAYYQYTSVMSGDKEKIMGVPAYKAILDTYDVKYILIPAISRNGMMPLLIPTLVDNPEWRLIFYSKNCLLFTNKDFEPDFPKVLSYAAAMASAYSMLGDNHLPYLTIARSELGLGRRDDAINFLKTALKKKPSLKGGPVEKALNLILEGKDILHQGWGLP